MAGRPSLLQRKSRIANGGTNERESMAFPSDIELRSHGSPTPTPTPESLLDDERGKGQDMPSGPGPPPDGGLEAWLQVLGAFFLNFNTWYVFYLTISCC